MRALTITLTFVTAQFKKHLIKLYRDTYLIPPPSSVAGIIGAIMGINRHRLKELTQELKIMTGAMLLNYEGTIGEVTTIVKIKNWREFIRTPKRSISLYKPKYKLAVASSSSDFVDNLRDRISRLDFEYEVYGGNDYNFLASVDEVKAASYSEDKEAYGYCRLEDLEALHGKESSVVLIDAMNDGSITRYAFGFGTPLKTKEPRPCVDDGEHKIFVHESWKFLR